MANLTSTIINGNVVVTDKIIKSGGTSKDILLANGELLSTDDIGGAGSGGLDKIVTSINGGTSNHIAVFDTGKRQIKNSAIEVGTSKTTMNLVGTNNPWVGLKENSNQFYLQVSGNAIGIGSTWANSLTVDGDGYATAAGYKVTDSSNDNILLAGGGTKSLNTITKWKNTTDTTINNIKAQDGLYVNQAQIPVSDTGAAVINHSVFLNAHDVGTPFILQFPDSTNDYIYKWTTIGKWRKTKAGYADSAGRLDYFTTTRTNFGWGELSKEVYTNKFDMGLSLDSGGDTGDIAFALKKVSDSATELNMQIDGDIFVHTGAEKLATEKWVSSQLSNNTNYVTLNTKQTITGFKTFDSPTNQNTTEQATVWFNTSNGGRAGFGKEGPNSGTAFFLEQTRGTRRLNFRGSDTPGAVVWEQPESNAALYFDIGGGSKRITMPSGPGTIALLSDVTNNGDTWHNGNTTWTPKANIQLNATNNNDEWSFDFHSNGKTGSFWHVWDDRKDSLLKVDADSGLVSAPYGVSTSQLNATDIIGDWQSASARISSPDIEHTYRNGRASVQLNICTSSMTGNKPPEGDGYIQTYKWDNSGAYDAQLYIPDHKGHLQARFRNDKTWLNDWKTLAYTEECLTQTHSTSTYSAVEAAEYMYRNGKVGWYEGQSIPEANSLPDNTLTIHTIPASNGTHYHGFMTATGSTYLRPTGIYWVTKDDDTAYAEFHCQNIYIG